MNITALKSFQQKGIQITKIYLFKQFNPDERKRIQSFSKSQGQIWIPKSSAPCVQTQINEDYKAIL